MDILAKPLRDACFPGERIARSRAGVLKAGDEIACSVEKLGELKFQLA
jgi:hypothetical protein